MSNWEYTETELWRHNEGDYSIFHVFSLCAIGDTVLVFSEGRYGNGSDADCAHDIRMKRSFDGGRTFGEDVCILSAGNGVCWTNASPVYDHNVGRLFLFFSDNQNNVRTENMVMFSDDRGTTWSKPRSVTSALERVKIPLPFHLAGPGHGICLKKGPFAGRLLMQFWHRSENRKASLEERGYCVSVLYSDDHGETWQTTEYLGADLMVNESRLAEVDGGIRWYARTKGLSPATSFSSDGGMTWLDFSHMDLPPARSCDLGAVSLFGENGLENAVFISRLSHETLRNDMEILMSFDGGKHFTERFPLMPGDVMPGYSDLCILKGEEPAVGLVHCRHNHVLFSRISLQALTGGKYEKTERFVWLQ
ncbi:MAG: exo-alpha-sialidase [Clostridia bacterium]|nr:exo-alpha-sialidase [Clostridia bacterium]